MVEKKLSNNSRAVVISEIIENDEDPFVGIKYDSNGSVEWHYPKLFDKSFLSNDDDEKAEIRHILVLCISRYLRLSEYRKGSGAGTNSSGSRIAEVGNKKAHSQVIVLANKLLLSWSRRNSLLRKINHGYQSDADKTDWDRTLDNDVTMVDSSQVIFLDYIGRRTSKNSTIEYQIFEDACYSASVFLRNIGLVPCSIPLPKKILKMSTEQKCITLTKGILKEHDMKKRELLELAINFLRSSSSALSSTHQVGTYNFAKVWEEVVRHIFASQGLEDHVRTGMNMPRVNYVSLMPGVKDQSASGAHDVLSSVDDKVVLIDAKYYRANELPPFADVMKQIGYEKYFCDNGILQVWQNVFLLPHMKESTEVSHQAIVGNFRPIACIRIPLLQCLRAFANKGGEIHSLRSSFETALKK